MTDFEGLTFVPSGPPKIAFALEGVEKFSVTPEGFFVEGKKINDDPEKLYSALMSVFRPPEGRDRRLAEARPLIEMALRYLEKAREARHRAPEDPGHFQRVLDLQMDLEYARKCLLGVLGLFGHLPTTDSYSIEFAVGALDATIPVAKSLSYMATDDAELIGSLWILFDRLIVPKIGLLKEALSGAPPIEPRT